MKITIKEYYHVHYLHKSGSTGAMGVKHEKLDDAIAQITSLKRDGDKEYSDNRDYYIIHVKATFEEEIIEYKKPEIISE